MKCLLNLPIFIISIVILLASCGNKHSGNRDNSKDSLQGNITISGAFALYPLVVKWADEYSKLHPNVNINVSAGGAGKGMTDALSGMVELGMYSKSISEEEKNKGAWWISVAKDAVLGTVSDQNPSLKDLMTKGLTKEQLYDVFITNKTKIWGQLLKTSSKEEINVYTRSDACGAAEMWAKYLNNSKQEDIQAVGINGDPGMADALKKDLNGIGYNNVVYAYDMNTRKKFPGIEVVPLDINGNGKIDADESFYNSLDDIMKAIKDGRYPTPPSRDLYLIAKGKPENKLVLNFLHWILTEGQKFVPEAGYVTLTDEALTTEKTKIQ